MIMVVSWIASFALMIIKLNSSHAIVEQQTAVSEYVSLICFSLTTDAILDTYI